MRILVISRRHPTRRHAAVAPDNGPQLDALARRHDLRLIRPVPVRGAALTTVGSLRAGRSRTAELPGQVCPTFADSLAAWTERRAAAFDASVRAAALALTRSFQPDIILGSWEFPDGWTAVRLARHLELPVVLKAYGVHPQLRGKDRSRERALVDLLTADAVAATSRAAARATVALGVSRRRVLLVPDGVARQSRHRRASADARRALGLPETGALILGVGDGLMKGAVDLVKACAILRGRDVDARCHLIGAGANVEALRAAIRSRGLEDRVTIHDPTERSTERTWLDACDVVIYPGYTDHASHVLRVAIELGRPVVATRVGCVPELVPSSCGTLVLAGATGELADAVADMLEDPREISADLAERVNPSWEESARQLSTLLELTVERRAAMRAKQNRPGLSSAPPIAPDRRLDAGPDVERLRSLATRRRR